MGEHGVAIWEAEDDVKGAGGGGPVHHLHGRIFLQKTCMSSNSGWVFVTDELQEVHGEVDGGDFLDERLPTLRPGIYLKR